MKMKKWGMCCLGLTLAMLLLTGCAKGNDKNKEGLDLYLKGFYSEAVTVFQEAIAKENRNPEYYTNLAMAYVALGDYESAKKNCDQALSLDDGYKLAYRQRGIACLKNGEYEESLQWFQKELDSTDGRVTAAEYDVLKYRGEAELALGDFEAAAETYSILIDVEGKPAENYYLRGNVYAESGNIEAACADFDKAIENSGNDYALYWNIYNSLAGAGAGEQAQSYLNAALLLSDEKDTAHKYRGMFKYVLGDYSSAMSELAAYQDKDDIEALQYLGMTYEALGDTGNAYHIYEGVLALDATNKSMLNQMAVYFMNKGDYTAALDYINRGLAAEGMESEKELLYNEAIVYEYLLDFGTAREKLQAYVDKYGADEAAQRELTFLNTR